MSDMPLLKVKTLGLGSRDGDASVINWLAHKVNMALGVRIYDTSRLGILQVVTYTKGDAKRLCIDDLIDAKGRATGRLRRVTASIALD